MNLTTEDFVFLAVKGFSLGFVIGFIAWGLSYVVRTVRRAFFSAMKIVE